MFKTVLDHVDLKKVKSQEVGEQPKSYLETLSPYDKLQLCTLISISLAIKIEESDKFSMADLQHL